MPRLGELVIARTTAVFARAPLAGNEPFLLESLERGVQRSLVNLERAIGDLLDALTDSPPVHGFERERFEHEEVERAAEGVGLRAGGHAWRGGTWLV